MQRRSAISKSRLKRGAQRHGLVFGATVANRIIGIALERYVREVPAHPHIERIVKKEIRQEGADDAMNAKDNFRIGLDLGPASPSLEGVLQRG